jgi:Ca2+-binding EF-hand superfamily protein
MKTLILVIAGTIGVLALAGCASTVRGARNLNPFTASTGFQHYDIDGNGVISRQEAAKYKPLKANFKTLDTNQDGVISPDEFNAALTFLQVPPHFNHYDVNGDGVITENEACKAGGDLCDNCDRVDSDGDDNVSKSEFRAARVNLLKGVPFSSIDTDGDGVISQQEAKSNNAILWQVFSKVDLNDDDHISKKEYRTFQRKGISHIGSSNRNNNRNRNNNNRNNNNNNYNNNNGNG